MNTKLICKENTYKGRKYRDFYCETKLNNGETVYFAIKLAFYNKKFAYKLAKGIENEETK